MRTENPNTDRRALLAGIMARLPDDPAAEVSLYLEFGGPIRARLSALARELGLPTPSGDDLDGLALDACEVIAGVARSWDPDGALPWTYARHRLAALLRRWAGPRTVPLDGPIEVADEPVLHLVVDEPAATEVLDRLIRDLGDPLLLRLRDALDRTVRPADSELVLHYWQQLAAADPSPAHTVGSMVGRSPAAVRQAFCRARKKLRLLAVTDPSFGPLLTLPLLADTGREEAA